MKKQMLVVGCWLLVQLASAQSIKQKMQAAYQQFESDTQLRHAISSLYVINAKTGEVVFDRNSRVGLACASTQKIITAATALELLGKDYRYRTELGMREISPGLNDIFIRSFGDPTFGSWRYSTTKPDTIINSFFQQLIQSGYKDNLRQIVVDNFSFQSNNIPGGWIWDDIGNYYGAGAAGLNWRENQYDLALRSSDKIDGEVQVLSFNGKKTSMNSFVSEATSAAKGTGDNAYIYLPVGGDIYTVRGTIPVDEDSFIISGAIADPVSYFAGDFGEFIHAHQKVVFGKPITACRNERIPPTQKMIYIHYSPSLDSIVYWFFKRSINLYGEALIKTFAYEKYHYGSTDSGLAIVKRFWKEEGFDADELNIKDGSGLSPQNRITTHAQVEILKYAKQQPWFNSFYDALPEFNNMKMKSGTIADVKAYCGYQTSSNGNEYIFSFLVNNYNGRASTVVSKMYKVLDVLK